MSFASFLLTIKRRLTKVIMPFPQNFSAPRLNNLHHIAQRVIHIFVAFADGVPSAI